SPLCQLRTVREACQRRRRRRLEGRTGYQPAQQVEPDWEEEHQTEANSLSVSDGPRWHVSKVGTAEPAVVSRATGCGLCEMPCRLSEALDFTINCQVALAINSGCISSSRFRNALTTLSGWLSAGLLAHSQPQKNLWPARSTAAGHPAFTFSCGPVRTEPRRRPQRQEDELSNSVLRSSDVAGVLCLQVL